MRVVVIAKVAFLLAIAGISIWAFREPAEQAGEVTAAVNIAVGDPEAPYRIAVAPISFYMPGTLPVGAGKPLRGFIDVAEAFVRDVYPDVQIEFRNVPSSQREWLVTQLSSGEAPDIIGLNVEEVWPDVHKGWYLALDPYLERPNPFIPAGQPGSKQWWDQFVYQAISRGKAGPDGKNYCVCLDMVETGIFYNKTKFRELGIDVPKDWAEFMRIQQVIKDAGYIPFLTVSGTHMEWGVDQIFDQLYYGILPGIDLVKDPAREAYLQGYLDADEICFLYRKGFFTPRDPRWREVFRIMKAWRPYWNRDIGDTTTDRFRAFFSQRGLMMWDASWSVYRFSNDPDMRFEWDVFYLPPITKATSPFASGVKQCVIGGACAQFAVTNSAFKDTGDPATSERLKRVMAFLQFLFTPQQADRVINEAPMLLPNVKGVEPDPSLHRFAEFLKRRYTTTKWTATFDQEFYNILRRMLNLYLNDGIDEDGFLAWMDRALGTATTRMAQRVGIDFAKYEARWEALAPVRATMKGLPDGAR
jgi:raffinose/stachyose/melibiose transport system substrate-binding protein